MVSNAAGSNFLRRALLVGFFALAMSYLEAAVVVYLQRALSINPLALFPLRDLSTLGGFGTIEVGREVATLIMLVSVGWLAGRNAMERMGWVAIAFGIWDLGYYAWLWIFIGWPTKLGTFDLLFLIPVPWVAPVWAPMVISLALILFGLLVVRRLRLEEMLRVKLWHVVATIVGGLVVIFSFTIDARRILAGGTPSTFAWPVFVAGLALAIIGVAPLCWPERN
jgi:hypothetical protein